MDKTAIIETWTESEAGWGQRPDGISIHESKEDYESYLKEYWNGMPDSTPEEYSRPDSTPRVANISDELFSRLNESENGIRIWQNKIGELKEEIDYIL